MPIIDIQLVERDSKKIDQQLPQTLANQIGSELGASAGRVWVRMAVLPADHYAENNQAVADDHLPVFVTVLHARPPVGTERAREVAALTAVVARCTARRAERVHIEYAPPGVGRIAFGGALVG